VSKNKRRYQADGYDLDLTYICPNLLAMGFPAEKVEGFYRNNMDDVVSFLENKHPSAYKVYNLCSERAYDTKKFHDRVASYPFDDHSPPRFELIKPFCEDVDQWLGRNPKNIAAIHCKAGKGRTGVMICCYLLHRQRFTVPADVLNFYGLARTNNSKGVTIASQQRYVGYYSDLTRFKLNYRPCTLLLHSIQFDMLPTANNHHNSSGGGSSSSSGNASAIEVYVSQMKVRVHKSSSDDYVREHDKVLCYNKQAVPICGDIKVDVYRRNLVQKEKLFHFWFNTFFLQFGNALKHSDWEKAESSSACQSIYSPEYEDDEDNNSGSSGSNSRNGSHKSSAKPEVDHKSYCLHYPSKANSIVASFARCELDRTNKDEMNKLFASDFKCTLVLSNCTTQETNSSFEDHRRLVNSMSSLNLDSGVGNSTFMSSSSEPDINDIDDDSTFNTHSDEAEDERDWEV